MSHFEFMEEECDEIVSVVIPVYKDLSGLKDTIASIKHCRTIPGWQLEIIVVNDGASTDISAYCCDESLIEVSISPNKGSYYARNRGLEFSRGCCIGFVDADIIVDEAWVQNAVLALKGADYVAGAIKVTRGLVSPTVVDYQQLIDFNTKWHLESMKYGPTANVWITRKVVHAIGGFNENLFSGGDMDFGIRVHASGTLKAVYDESVQVVHPPRNFWGLLQKSKRLAYGHTTSKGQSDLQSKFSIWGSLKRNLGHKSVGRKIPFKVQCLRIFLYVHRLFYKLYYKFFLQHTEFDKVVNSNPVISKNDFSHAS